MTSETAVSNIVKLEASNKGHTLWRNNVGAMHTDKGGFVRFGLANESAQVNKIIKSADLIGIRRVLITSEMVGRVIGQFLSREVKNSAWKGTIKTEREIAQKNWMDLVIALGGDACFAIGEGTL